ncbi:MAG TPA: carbohydrate binding domain-containing protein [Candidatus Hydrogenedentes bacterium]|nr:carbohydrate binding domain-containing protein [Candidatus Hydrogenedentota bacterium]
MGENLLKNAGFEQSADNGLAANWNSPGNVYHRDTEVKHSGEASLTYANTDKNAYLLCSQPVALLPGKMYEISAWIKTQDVVGDETGATICVEYSDAQGKWAGGCYPEGVKGTSDWTQVKSITPRIPPEAKHIGLSCYLRREMTGTAWWDDMSVAPVAERPLSSMLMSPNYRNQVLGPNPDPVKIRCLTNLTDYPLQLSDVLLVWRLSNEADHTIVAQGGMNPVPAESMDIVMDGKALLNGRYTAEITLKSKNGDTLATDTWAISRNMEILDRKAYIDAHNRLILNGEPFFPLGMYWGSVTAEQLDVYAQSAFNCLMPYGPPSQEMMDAIQAHGLKVIYTVKDLYFGSSVCPPDIHSKEEEYARIKSTVEQFRDHPALMAWYINDELPLEMLEQLSQHRQWIEDLDPNHPAWVVLYQIEQIREYLPSYDVIGTDPYPIPQQPPAKAGEYARKMMTALCGSRAIWQVPQVFNWANYQKNETDKAAKRTPTFEEMRSMAWQSIAEGAMGIVFYSWFDIHRDPTTPFEEQWGKIKKIAQEIKEMSPVLLSIENPPQIVIETAPWLNALIKHSVNATYVVLVNNTREGNTARFTLPAAVESITDQTDGKPVVSAPGATNIEYAMEPLGVHILIIRWKS